MLNDNIEIEDCEPIELDNETDTETREQLAEQWRQAKYAMYRDDLGWND